MASGSKSAIPRTYKNSKRPRTVNLDPSRFHSTACEEVFYQIMPQEQITDCYFFNIASIDRTGLKIRDFFDKLGISKFVEIKNPIYPDLVREFYANLHVGTHSSSSTSIVFSLVCGQKIIVSQENLKEIFGLNYEGFDCYGNDSESDDESTPTEIDIREFLSSKAVIDITDDSFENNDFGVDIRLFLVALTCCLMPKINTQHKLVGVDKQIVYHVLKGEEVNFASIVLKWMMSKGDIFHSKNYAFRTRKAGLPFGSVLTGIFTHHKIDLQGEISIPVSRGHEISSSSLKAMNYVATINRGWVLFPYLRENDEVPKGTRVPTPAERITKRGPETIRELQTGSFVRPPKVKGKRKVSIDEEEESELAARIRGLETTQLEIREDVRGIRTEVESVKTLLSDFIRSINPNFPFPTSQ